MAQRLGLIARIERRRPGWPSATNIIRICSREWLAWLRIGPGFGKATTHGQQEFKKKGENRAARRARAAVERHLARRGPRWRAADG